ncbi:putative SET domain, Zinc finger, MYND-type, tetratricopeptide-like helical domain superfamily [Plasmopara halstedii]
MAVPYHEVLDARKGRCFIASAALRAGSCVLRTPAICAVSYSACNWCFATQVTLQRCTGCRNVRYCSRACQQQDWPLHRCECSAWRSIPSPHTTHNILFVARLAVTLYLDSINKEEKTRVLELCHHLDDHTEIKRQEIFDMTQLVLQLLSRYKFAGKEEFVTHRNELKSEIMKLFGRVKCNAFTITENVTHESIGIGLFPHGSVFNHDCDPNCIVSFKDREMLVHVVKDVEKGQELTLSYIDVMQSSKMRQKELKESYFFECTCARCLAAIREETMEDWYLGGLLCNDKDCVDGIVVVSHDKNDEIASAICKKCGAVRNVEEIMKYQKEIKLKQKGNVSEHDMWMTYQRQWEIAIKILKLHHWNAQIAVMAREIGQFLLNATSAELRRHALHFFMSELRAVGWLLPHLTLPTRGTLHLQIGILLHDQVSECFGKESPAKRAEQLQEAEKHLQQSLFIMDCAYGSASKVVQLGRTMLDDVRRTAQQVHRQKAN